MPVTTHPSRLKQFWRERVVALVTAQLVQDEIQIYIQSDGMGTRDQPPKRLRRSISSWNAALLRFAPKIA